MKKEARIIYYNDEKGKEEYRIELYDKEIDEWGLDTAYPFRRCTKNPDAETADYLHFNIINKLFELKRLGYTIHDER